MGYFCWLKGIFHCHHFLEVETYMYIKKNVQEQACTQDGKYQGYLPSYTRICDDLLFALLAL